MTTKETLINRTRKFAHDCVKVALTLPENNSGFHSKEQLKKCSTSVASIYRAADIAQSKASFTVKLPIVIEEADESEFWLESGADERIIVNGIALPLIKEAQALAPIFISSRKSIQAGY